MWRIRSSQLKAFTLPEMLVVMVLGSMIVGIVYFSYYTVQKYQLSLSRKYDELDRFNVFYNSLLTDIERSERVTATDQSTLNCELKCGSAVKYEFSGFLISRTQGSRVDTIRCESSSTLFNFRNNPVTIGVIDEVVVTVNRSGHSSAVISAFKIYDAATLLRTNNNAAQ